MGWDNDMIAEARGMLAVDLATGFDFGDGEGDSKHQFIVSSLGKKLDPYFMRKEKGENAAKPALRLLGWWSDLLKKFEAKKFPGWIKSSHALLPSAYPQHQKFHPISNQLFP